jgi:hypothetical protein
MPVDVLVAELMVRVTDTGGMRVLAPTVVVRLMGVREVELKTGPEEAVADTTRARLVEPGA